MPAGQGLSKGYAQRPGIALSACWEMLLDLQAMEEIDSQAFQAYRRKVNRNMGRWPMRFLRRKQLDSAGSSDLGLVAESSGHRPFTQLKENGSKKAPSDLRIRL